jgi:branched-chain amino acid transport system ATP-binding protein
MANSAAPLLVIEQLHIHYGAIHALRGVSLTVTRGEIVTLIGSNGAGKTTTLRAISGLVRPSSGAIRFAGQSIGGRRPEQIVRLGIAHAPEGRGIFPNLSVRDNLELGAYVRHDPISADLERAFARFPRLRERAGQLAGTLSGGEQQLLAVARALMARPQLLLLDEPSLGLAPQVVRQIFALIREINLEGTTILLVEQNAHMALSLAHRGYVLETGAIKMGSDAKALAASEEVKKSYLGIS